MRPSVSVVLALVAATLAAAPAAIAADQPTILTAGIDADDRLHATWSLGAGTTYERTAFSTSPAVNPFLAGFFLAEDFADFDCAGEKGCTGLASGTSYTGSYPVARDRRYFVTVTAGAEKDRQLTSAMWVIDEAKPLITGDAPGGDPHRPTRSPAGGRLLSGAPDSSLTVLRLPRRAAGVMRAGVRVRVRCSTSCDVDLRLSLGKRTLVRRTGRLPAGASRLLPFAPGRALWPTLQARPRQRLRIAGTVTPLGGLTEKVSRTFTVRR